MKTKPIPTSYDWLGQHAADPEAQRLYAQESCIVAATEAIAAAIEESGLTRREIAARLGRSPAFVTKTLNGPGNLELRTVADLLWAVGKEVADLTCRPLGQIEALDTSDLFSEHMLLSFEPGASAAVAEPSQPSDEIETSPPAVSRVLEPTRVLGALVGTAPGSARRAA